MFGNKHTRTSVDDPIITSVTSYKMFPFLKQNLDREVKHGLIFSDMALSEGLMETC